MKPTLAMRVLHFLVGCPPFLHHSAPLGVAKCMVCGKTHLENGKW